jgi:DNA-binding response OmpR family regulator
MNNHELDALKNITILCVEDETGIREFVVNTLKYYFKEVYEASNGEEAYELYEEYKPKIVLTDIQMPKMDGIELVKKIRQNDNSTMIIMLTAHSNEEYLMNLINLNIDHFILKPLNSKKLNLALHKYINRNFSQEIMLHQDVILNLSKRELLYKNSTVIPLRKREKEFLHLLYKNKNTITTYMQIEMELWQDKYMTNDALKSFIKELRNKIPINLIKNSPQDGYYLDKE